MAIPQPSEPIPAPDRRSVSSAGSGAPRKKMDPAVAAMFYESMLERPVRKRTTALLLCLLFGGFGAHRFYVGKKGSGRLYLFTGGLFGIGVLYDLVLICMGTFDDHAGNPLG